MNMMTPEQAVEFFRTGWELEYACGVDKQRIIEQQQLTIKQQAQRLRQQERTITRLHEALARRAASPMPLKEALRSANDEQAT